MTYPQFTEERSRLHDKVSVLEHNYLTQHKWTQHAEFPWLYKNEKILEMAINGNVGSFIEFGVEPGNWISRLDAVRLCEYFDTSRVMTKME